MTLQSQTFDMDTAKLIAEATVEAVLASGAVPGQPTGSPQLNAILGLLLQERRDAIEWRKRIEAELAENTSLTRTVQTAVTAGKFLTWAIKWIAGLALAGSTIYTVLYMMSHGGALPGSGPTIGPTP